MNLVKWDPWREMEGLLERYNRAEGLPQISGLEGVFKGEWSPRVDIAETDNDFIIKAEIPEVDKKDVKVCVEDGILTISGERKQEKEEKGKTFHRVERQYGSFSRSFTLPGTVLAENVKASFKEGMLTVNLKKMPETKPKAIDVHISS